MKLGLGSFPITAKLLNMLYLAEAAVLTRLAIGLVRINENKPSKLAHTRLNANEKRQGVLERFFVEVVGTFLTVFTLHIGQDILANIFERKTRLDDLLAKTDALLTDGAERAKVREAVQDVFAKNVKGKVVGSNGLISRVLYGYKTEINGEKVVRRANLVFLKEKLGPELFGKIESAVDPFVRRLKRSASFSILFGIGLSALCGGFVVQWVNDRLYAPSVAKILKRIYGDMPSSERPVPQPQYSPAFRQLIPNSPIAPVYSGMLPYNRQPSYYQPPPPQPYGGSMS